MVQLHSRRKPSVQGPALLPPAGRERDVLLRRLRLRTEPRPGRNRRPRRPPRGGRDVRPALRRQVRPRRPAALTPAAARLGFLITPGPSSCPNCRSAAKGTLAREFRPEILVPSPPARLAGSLARRDPRAARPPRRAIPDVNLVDHAVLRRFWTNRGTVAEGVYRSNQPSPRMIARLADEGIRTIVNLRGPSHFGSYALEREACERHGITLIDFRLYSAACPARTRSTR